MANKSRVEQIINWLMEQNLGQKYNKPGVYSISIAGKLVYIGKSLNMLERIANHIAHIEYPQKTHKYQILNQAKQEGYEIQFDVVYYSQQEDKSEIEKEIGNEEGRLIRQYRPALNYQIPKEEDYTHFTVNRRAKWVTLKEILNLKPEGFYF